MERGRSRTRRRDLLALLAAAALAVPRFAQAAAQPRRVAVLIGIAANDPAAQDRMRGFLSGLKARGWRDGENVAVLFRFAGGEAERFAQYAKEIVAWKPEVIVAVTTASVEAVLKESRTIPIVFLQVADPTNLRLVASMSHPGGIATGFTNFEASMGGKWLELLLKIAPNLSRVAVMYNPETTPAATLFMRSIQAVASVYHAVKVMPAHVRDGAEIKSVIATLGEGTEHGLIVLPDNLTMRFRQQIIAGVGGLRLPTIYPFRAFALDGGLVVYGVDPSDDFARAAGYVDRLLKGAIPSELPVQAPTKFMLILNRKTANAQGIAIPSDLLVSANEVID